MVAVVVYSFKVFFFVVFLKLKKLALSASLESSEETLPNNCSKDLQKLEGEEE